MARSGVLVRAGNRKGTPAMYGYGKSDDPIVPKKQPNKGERSLAEVVSMRPLYRQLIYPFSRIWKRGP